uniref:Uncharacterized protein n=1 Tax=Triticum urartu TaxID=4572 RepID=A0A8R7TCC3_TRIUA
MNDPLQHDGPGLPDVPATFVRLLAEVIHALHERLQLPLHLLHRQPQGTLVALRQLCAAHHGADLDLEPANERAYAVQVLDGHERADLHCAHHVLVPPERVPVPLHHRVHPLPGGAHGQRRRGGQRGRDGRSGDGRGHHRADEDRRKGGREDDAGHAAPYAERPEATVQPPLLPPQPVQHAQLLPVRRLERGEELVRERLAGRLLEPPQRAEGARWPDGRILDLEREVQDELRVAGAAEGLVERGEEVEGVEAGVEVVLHEREQLGAPPHVVLAGEDDADHLLVHVHQAAGDLAEGAQGHGPHLHPGRRRRHGEARAPPQRRVEAPQLRVRAARRLVRPQLMP